MFLNLDKDCKGPFVKTFNFDITVSNVRVSISKVLPQQGNRNGIVGIFENLFSKVWKTDRVHFCLKFRCHRKYRTARCHLSVVKEFDFEVGPM